MADGDILDYISNNWQQLTGLGPMANAAAPLSGGINPPAPPQAPPPQMQPPPPQPDPSQMASLGPQPPPTPPINPQNMPALPPGQFADAWHQDMGANGLVNGPNAPTGPGTNLGGGPTQVANAGGGPPIRPGDQYGGVSPGDPNGRGRPIQTADNSGKVAIPSALAGQPAPLPPQSAMGGAPPTSAGGLQQQLGLTPAQKSDMTGRFLSGLGKGLSAVGSTPRGANAGQAFAAGAGGALTGGQAQGNLQTQQKQQAQNQLFNQQSTYFRDMIAAKAQDNNEAYKQAQEKYLAARTQGLQNGTLTGAGRGVPKTDYDRVMGIDGLSLKLRDQLRKTAEKNAQLNGTPIDQAAIDKQYEDFKSKLYKQSGIDPSSADKLRNRGTTEDNPFPTKGMTMDDFNSQVPLGAYFTDQNGTVRQRTVPPPGAATAPVSPQAAYPDIADQAAMAG